MKFEGKEIYIGNLERNDFEIIWDEYEYDHEAAYERVNYSLSKDKGLEFYQEIQAHQGETSLYMGIFNKKPLGYIALKDIDKINRSASIELVIGKLANRNKGYGREALSLMVDYAFTYLGLERLTIDILENNKPLKNITEKQEFKLEGIEKKAVYYRGKKINRLNYALLKEI